MSARDNIFQDLVISGRDIVNLRPGDESRKKIKISPVWAGDIELAGDLTGEVSLRRVEEGVEVEYKMSGQIKEICDRCAETFSAEVDLEFSRFYRLESEVQEEEEEEFNWQKGIDLSRPIREEIILSRPFKKLCSEACQGVCPKCGANLNEGVCRCEPK